MSIKKILEAYNNPKTQKTKAIHESATQGDFASGRDLIKYLIGLRTSNHSSGSDRPGVAEWWGKGIGRFKRLFKALDTYGHLDDLNWYGEDEEEEISIKDVPISKWSSLEQGKKHYIIKYNNQNVGPWPVAAVAMGLAKNPNHYFYLAKDYNDTGDWEQGITSASLDDIIDEMYLDYIMDVYDALVDAGITKKDIRDYGIGMSTDNADYPSIFLLENYSVDRAREFLKVITKFYPSLDNRR